MPDYNFWCSSFYIVEWSFAFCRCMSVILSRLRQMPAFWEAQKQSQWQPTALEMIQTGSSDIGVLDDLEVAFILHSALN